MRTLIKNLGFLMLSTIVVWYIQDYLKDVPSATYSVSDAIEIVGPQEEAEYAQEIVVMNSGHSVINTISIKVPRHIFSYKITKHSNLVKEESIADDASFELVYPELPKEQSMKLLIRYKKTPIEKGSISVSHASGNAEAMGSQSDGINLLLLWAAFSLGFTVSLLIDIRRTRKDWFRRWAENKDLFRDDKPWFVASSKEWSEIQYEAIDRALERNAYGKVEQRLCYVLLNRQKPAMLIEDHWLKLEEKAISLLSESLFRDLRGFPRKSELIVLFKVQKPERFPQHKWNEFQSYLNERAEEMLLPAYSKDSDLIKVMSDKNILADFPDDLTDRINKNAEERYFDNLVLSISEAYSDPQAILKDAYLDLLTPSHKAKIEKLAIRFSRLRELPQNWSTQEFELFVSRPKPEWMPENEFSSLRELVSQLTALSNDRMILERERRELKATILETEALKNRVLAQLELIDKVLTTPNVIDRIEEYDTTFSSGNRKNLEKIASILKDKGSPA